MRIVVAVLAVLLSSSAWAKQVAGVDVPEQVEMPAGTVLPLNGAGTRSKFFFTIYVGALYLPGPAHTAAEVYAMHGPRRMLMHFIYHEVSRDKLVAAWQEGFAENSDAAQLQALAPRIAAFNDAFTTMKAGDRVRLDYLPDTGTEVWVNDVLRATIAGADFQNALLHIWLGEHPADSGLKRALLGG